VLPDARESETNNSSPEANSRAVSEQEAAQADFLSIAGVLRQAQDYHCIKLGNGLKLHLQLRRGSFTGFDVLADFLIIVARKRQ
jgi:hypothetical protein